MKKYLSFLIVVFLLVTNAMGAFAYNYAPYIGDGIIKATSVVFTDTDGKVVTSLTSGQEITATVRVKAGSEFDNLMSTVSDKTVTLIVASYSKGFIKEIKTDRESIGNATVLSTSITVPDDEPGIRVFMWDDVDSSDSSINARPLNKMGVVSAEASAIEQISVGGVLIEDFSPDVYEYDVTVNAGYISWPEVIAYTSNAATKVDATYEGNFPLSAPIRQKVDATEKVKGTSKTAVATIKVGNKEYKINITQEVPQITDIKLTYQKSGTKVDEVWPDVKNISVYMSTSIGEPKWTKELPGPNVESAKDMKNERKSEYYNFLKDYENSGASPMFAKGVFHYIYDMAPELLGAHQIIVEKDKAKLAASDDYLEFKLERSARVYAYVGPKEVDLKETPGWKFYQNLIYPTAQEGVRGALARYIGSSNDAYSHKLIKPAIYQDFVVKPGEKVTVTIPKGDEIGFTFIKYFESSNIVANASYQYVTEEGTIAEATSESYLLYKPLLANSEVAEDRLYVKYRPHGGLMNQSIKEDIVAKGSGNVLFGTSPFSDNPGYVPVSYDERFDGAQLLRMKLENLKYIKFDLTAPAKVYILTDITGDNFKNLKGCLEGWNVMGEGTENLMNLYNIVGKATTDKLLDEDGKQLYTSTGAIEYQKRNSKLSNKITEKTSFEKTYYVDYGETETVTLDFSGMALPTKKIIMVLVQPIN